MYTNRFITLIVAISLLAVTVLVVREANATGSLVANVDSATRSYTAWAKSADVEASTVDSATRSYSAQAKEVTCSVVAPSGLSLDSGTLSYIAWGLASDLGASCR